MKSLLWLLLVGLMFTAVGVGLRLRHGSPAPAVESPPARSDPTPTNSPAATEAPSGFVGVILAGETAELSARVDGRLDAVFVRPGDRVARGAPLAQLDVRALRHELAVADAALREAKQRFSRRAKLSSAAISREELVESKTQIVEKTARVNQLREAIDDARLTATFDGVVAARYVEPGSTVAAGRPIIRLISNDATRVRFAVPEEQSAQVTVGMRMRVQLPLVGVSLPAVVENVAPEVDTAARMVFIIGRVEVPARLKPRISPGLEARVWPDAPAETARSAR